MGGSQKLGNDEANVLRKILAEATQHFDNLLGERDKKIKAIMSQYETLIGEQDVYIRKLRNALGEPQGEKNIKRSKKPTSIPIRKTEIKLLPVEGTKQIIDIKELPAIARSALLSLARPSRAKDIRDEIERMGKTFSSTNPYATLRRALVKIQDIHENDDKTWEIKKTK
jgi:hypothetical protein